MPSGRILFAGVALALALASPVASGQSPTTTPLPPAPVITPPAAPPMRLPTPAPAPEYSAPIVLPSPAPAPAAAPPVPTEAPSYSDVCRVEPKPPWCREASATRAPERE